MGNFKRKNTGRYKPQINRKSEKLTNEWSLRGKTMSLKKTIINYITQMRDLKKGEFDAT